MKIVIIDSSSTQHFQPDEWPKALFEEVRDADIVLGMFSPHGPRIIKDRNGDLDVSEWRMGRGYADDIHAVRLDGSDDPAVCKAQNEKLVNDYDGPDRHKAPR